MEVVQGFKCNRTIIVSPLPSVPTVESLTHSSCIITTGSVTQLVCRLGSWTIVRSGTSSEITGTGSETTITGLAPGTYAFAITSGLVPYAYRKCGN
jgi:hypothetical protein